MGFKQLGGDYDDYLMLAKDEIELHFFLFEALDPRENYGQIYIRVSAIDQFYQSLLERNVAIHPNAPLSIKPWGQKEFALLDPDHNLLTFGASAT
ncbi:VOC family protein [Niabella insulamsoli]|uniref:VOC family protein n=1 Tax=Niabella insulamsoli TaxID=3144874 RepID=UPI0031FBA375